MNDKPIAYDAYQELADAYADHIDTKPHNAYYERPAMLSLLPDLQGKLVLDAGCGPGAHTAQLVARGATVVACDISERMLERARQRLQPQIDDRTIELRQIDLTRPLDMFASAKFDLINAALCLDYVEDWRSLFSEFQRILKPGGYFLFSCGHPSFDAEYFATENYFSVEQSESTWTGFGKHIRMPCYRRSLEEVFMPILDVGLVLDRVCEPQPTDDFKAADPVRYRNLMHRPGFLCIRCRKKP
jgi:SAM-dependent methyltransferase